MKQLLTESITASQAIEYMDKRQVVAITYDSEDGYSEYTRYLEIYAVGSSRSGNQCLIAFQRNNYSASLSGMVKGERGKMFVRPNDRIMWRIFLLDKITSIKPTKDTFNTSMEFISKYRPKLNLMYKNMGSVDKKIIPDGATLPPKTPIENPIDTNVNSGNTNPSVASNKPLDKEVPFPLTDVRNFKTIINKFVRDYSTKKNKPVYKNDVKQIDNDTLEAEVRISKDTDFFELKKTPTGYTLTSKDNKFSFEPLEGRTVSDLLSKFNSRVIKE
jgi:hypothetical protein